MSSANLLIAKQLFLPGLFKFLAMDFSFVVYLKTELFLASSYIDKRWLSLGLLKRQFGIQMKHSIYKRNTFKMQACQPCASP